MSAPPGPPRCRAPRPQPDPRWGGTCHPLPTPQNFQYHSPEFLANLTARPDCRVVPLDDAHWLMAGPAAAEYEAAVLGWLANTIGTAEAAPAVAAAAAAPASAAAATAGGEDKKDV